MPFFQMPTWSVAHHWDMSEITGSNSKILLHETC